MDELLYDFYITQLKQKFTDKEECIDYIKNGDFKKFKYTYGLEYRNPTTQNKSISKEEALNIMKRWMISVYKKDDETIYIREVSANDMW